MPSIQTSQCTRYSPNFPSRVSDQVLAAKTGLWTAWTKTRHRRSPFRQKGSQKVHWIEVPHEKPVVCLQVELSTLRGARFEMIVAFDSESLSRQGHARVIQEHTNYNADTRNASLPKFSEPQESQENLLLQRTIQTWSFLRMYLLNFICDFKC